MRFLLILLLSAPLLAQDDHKFLDKKSTLFLAGSATVAATDAITSCRTIRRGGTEDLLPVKSCAGVSVYLGTQWASQIPLELWLHKTGHHRMERFAQMFWSSGSVVGISYSLTHTSHDTTQASHTPLIVTVGR